MNMRWRCERRSASLTDPVEDNEQQSKSDNSSHQDRPRKDADAQPDNSGVLRARDCARLERELLTPQYQAMLQALQDRVPLFRQFDTWAEVLAFMRAGTSKDPKKDEILRPIFEAYDRDGDPSWQTILLVIFWPGLLSIYHKKQKWDENSGDQWSNVTCVFMQVINRVKVQERLSGFVQKVYNDTIHHLYKDYQRSWNQATQEIATIPWEIEDLVGEVDGFDHESVFLDCIYVEEVYELEKSRIRQCWYEGRISEADFHLVVGTRLYGQSLADYARNTGQNYEAIKKQRQRVDAKIGRFRE